MRSIKERMGSEVNCTTLTRDQYDKMAFKCPRCPNFATNNIRALNSHKRIHNNERRENNSLPTPVQNNTDDEDDPINTQTSRATEPKNRDPNSQLLGLTDNHNIINDKPDNLPTAEEVQNELLFSINPEIKEDTPSDAFYPRFREIMVDYSDNKWDQFITLIDEFTKAIRKYVKIDGIDSSTYKRNTIDPKDPTATQRLYRRNRRRALRLIKEQNSSCNVPISDLEDKFFKKNIHTPDLSIYNNAKKADRPLNAAIFSAVEVKKKLYESENTAPGPDSITYNHLKSFDLYAKCLTAIYNICLKAKKIPPA